MAGDDQGQGSGTDQNSDADDQNRDDQNQDGDEREGQDSDDSADDEGSGDDAKQTVSKTEFQKLFARMQAADRAKNAAEAKLREKERAEMGELDRAKSEANEHKQRADAAEERLKSMIIENAFHRENKFSWHDVGDAIAALDLSGVEVDEDGKVTGMADAIKAVAKKKPHYVKKNDQNDDQGNGEGPPAANGASNGKRKGATGETPDVKKLVSRFPALGK